jgi:hypothetical protein
MQATALGAAGKPISAFAVKSAVVNAPVTTALTATKPTSGLMLIGAKAALWAVLGGSKCAVWLAAAAAFGLLTDKPRPRDQTGGAYDLVSYRMPKGWIMVAEP